MNWIVAFMFLGCVYSAQGALRDVMGVCCDMGRQYATQDGVCGDLEFFPLFNIQEVDRPACIYIATGCCNHETPRLLCERGLLQRADYGSCDQIQSDNCYGVEKDCCNCCELGLMAYHAGAPCEITSLGEFCNHAFQTCCQRAFNDGDVDECTIPLEFGGAEGKCTEKCVNVIGDYKCECGEGKSIQADGFTCAHGNSNAGQPKPTQRPYSDPCDTAPCTQDCRSNTVTYQCSCRQGYTLQSDRATCTRDIASSVDPCSRAPCAHDCQTNGVDYQCSCRQGYQLSSDEFSCEAIRSGPNLPCATAPCSQTCQGFNNGTFQCTCHHGYQLDNNGFTCSRAVQRPADLCETAPCTQGCYSNGVTYQCRCDRGYLLNDDQVSCRDEDECVTGYYQCNPGERCVNTDGGYRCEQDEQCEPGYEQSALTGRCEDIDECEADPSPCELHQECINYAGHYYCNSICRQGYTVIRDARGGRHTCQDVDECSLNLHDCAAGQRCDNLAGSFRCTREVPCGTGYTVNGETQKCEDVDECALGIHDCDLYYTCNNTLGSFRCERCPPGFTAAPGVNICTKDIDECSDPNICRQGETCDNTYGSYRCTSRCGKGLEFVSYLSRCMDIDECARGSHTCGPNQLCKNTMGSHQCQCKEGFQYDFATQTCDDLDECEEGIRLGRPKCRSHESCENTPGSFRCTPACPYGQKYVQTGNTWNCTDINECLLGTHNCRQDEICVNDAYNGTYRCIRCIRGTVFNAAARTCDDIDECNSPQGRVCIGICNNNPGSFFCTCPTGYNMIQSRVCRDIDECQVGTHRCRSDQLCFNTKGSHRCMNLQCPPYYNKRITGRQMRCDKIQPQLCPPPHQDRHNCASNRTSPIIYFPLALRSYPELPQGQDVLTLRIPAPSDIINFSLDYGNEKGIFAVEKRQAGQTEGVLKLVSAIEGPYQTEVHMSIRTDVSERYQPEQWVETSKAIIMVDVSPFDF